MNKSLMLIGCVGVLIIDIHTSAVVAAPPVAAPVPYIWEGIYIGGSVGYSWKRLSVDDMDAFLVPSNFREDNKGFIGGGQIGYNWQNRGLVVGIEADISSLSDKSSLNFKGCCYPPFIQINSKIDALGTVRGRVGIAVDPALLYLTGGAAFGDVNNSYNSSALMATWNDNGWRAGWIFGAGLEAKWNANWSWKVEALYYQLSENTVSLMYSPFGGIYRVRFDNQGLVARVGFDYQFGAPFVNH